MTTDLATNTGPQPAVPAVTGPDEQTTANALAALTAPPTNDAMARLQEWVTAAAQAEALVAPLVHSAFVPDAYKPQLGANATPQDRAYAIQVATANATSAVLLGLSIGLDPLTALQQIYLVKGRPGMYAKAKVALLQSRGYEIVTREYTAESATVAGRRPGSDQWEVVTITMEDARRAEWTSNAAYKKTPADMLWSRAAGRVCDRIGGTVLMGIATAEDLSDVGPVRVEATTGAPVRRATAADVLGPGAPQAGSSAPVENPATPPATAATNSEPWLEVPAPGSAQGVVDLGDVELTPVQMITDEQRDHLSILLGHTGRRVNAAKKFIKDTIGKDVDGPQDLTYDEAERVIAALQAEVDRRAGGDPQ